MVIIRFKYLKQRAYHQEKTSRRRRRKKIFLDPIKCSQLCRAKNFYRELNKTMEKAVFMGKHRSSRSLNFHSQSFETETSILILETAST